MIGWGDNDRGVSYTFGRDIVRDFTSRHGISLICRAHQVVEDGYQFFEQRKVLAQLCEYSHFVFNSAMWTPPINNCYVTLDNSNVAKVGTGMV